VRFRRLRAGPLGGEIMDRQTLTTIVRDVLRELGASFPSFIVQEDAEQDTVARGGYSFHVGTWGQTSFFH
jgi:hypothetical protein